MTEKTGIEAMRETADKIKAESAAEKQISNKEMEVVKNDMAVIRENPALAKMFTENAGLGSKNLAGELPSLKVHATGRSNNNILRDGNEPNDGWFYYKPTQQQFKTVNCHILTISRGFRADGFEGKKNVFNQVMAGLIVDDGEMKPFIFYFTGTKLQSMWNFGKMASKYTKAKPVPIPMFALKVRLSTDKIDTTFNKTWVINFEILKTPTGDPDIVTDMGTLQFLKDSVIKVEETIERLIDAKATDEVENEPVKEVKSWNDVSKIKPVEPGYLERDNEEIPF